MANHAQRRLREKNELRLKILEAARELFSVGGEEAVTLRGVAEKIEYSSTTIYQHFADKDALLQELCAAEFVQFSRVLKQAERLADPVERLRKIAAAYIDFGLQYPGHYRLMFMPSAGNAAPAKTPRENRSDTPAAPAKSGTSEATVTDGPYAFLQAAVFKAMAAGCFKEEHGDVTSIALVIWSGLHGVIALQMVRAKHPAVPWKPVNATAQMLTDCLLAGLLEPRFAAKLEHPTV